MRGEKRVQTGGNVVQEREHQEKKLKYFSKRVNREEHVFSHIRNTMIHKEETFIKNLCTIALQLYV